MRRPSPTYCPKFDHVRRGFREVWILGHLDIIADAACGSSQTPDGLRRPGIANPFGQFLHGRMMVFFRKPKERWPHPFAREWPSVRRYRVLMR